MARKKSDPLLAALIAKLPASGHEWPVDQQFAWLNMFATAFGVVYGGDVAALFTGKRPAAVQVAPTRPKIDHPFMIDEGGFVRNTKTAKRVLAKDVEGSIFDVRGPDADLRTVIWADSSTGMNGKDLVISS